MADALRSDKIHQAIEAQSENAPCREKLLMRHFVLATHVALSVTAAEAQEFEISAYLGVQNAHPSDVEGEADGPFAFDLGWDGKSFENPVYYGLRGTWWVTPRTGVGVELNHQKVYGDAIEIEAQGFDRLEFTDGLNLVTVNAMRRFPDAFDSHVTPYIGAGLGVAVPHVDVERGNSKTYEYQVTGIAAAAVAGISYDLTQQIAVFGEAKLGYARIDGALNGGGSIETSVVTRAANFGISYRF